MRRLLDPEYMSFPFKIGENGPKISRRKEHVREQIKQVIFTDPYERIFRPNFGAGLKALIFEPNSGDLRELTRKRLIHSLVEALQGEVDPRTLDVQIRSQEEKLFIEISYQLATIGQTERHVIPLTETGGVSG